MKKFLVTGGYGFIGSEVVNRIFTQFPQAEKLVLFDRVDYNSRPENINPEVRQDGRFKFVKGDICSYDLILHVLEEYQIDTIIHMAAQTHVDISFTNSLQFTRDNVMGTHTLLEACRQYGKLNRFVHMSTDEVYGEAEEEAHDENAHLNPTNPYAATKTGAEYIVKSYGRSYKFPYIIIRGNNVYGHGQYPDKLIPKFILLLELGKKLTIHGNGLAKRMFVHVNDMADGILLVTARGKLEEIYNIGSRNEYTVMDIAKQICDYSQKDINTSIEYIPDRNFNDKRYFIDYRKIQGLGWTEKIKFDEGLKQTIKWYRDKIQEFSKKFS